mmetsp:Transcript_12088/g.29974  ORF Transcript_12088/g.29974 Transcript_12088/m.29974 type:complete len:231 (+) Transcript_12088:390-1082(+)
MMASFSLLKTVCRSAKLRVRLRRCEGEASYALAAGARSSPATSDSTALNAAVAAWLMSGARPGFWLAVDCTRHWRNLAAAAHAALFRCPSALSDAARGCGAPPRRRRLTSCRKWSTYRRSSSETRRRYCCVSSLQWMLTLAGLVTSRSTLTRLYTSLRATSVSASCEWAAAAPPTATRAPASDFSRSELHAVASPATSAITATIAAAADELMSGSRSGFCAAVDCSRACR